MTLFRDYRYSVMRFGFSIFSGGYNFSLRRKKIIAKNTDLNISIKSTKNPKPSTTHKKDVLPRFIYPISFFLFRVFYPLSSSKVASKVAKHSEKNKLYFLRKRTLNMILRLELNLYNVTYIFFMKFFFYTNMMSHVTCTARSSGSF